MKSTAVGILSGSALSMGLLLRFAHRAPVLETADPSLVASLPPAAWIGGTLGAGILVGFLAGRARRERLLTPFLLPGLAAAIFVPGVFSAFPVVASFGGWFLDLLLLVALAVSIGRLFASRAEDLRPSSAAVGLAGFVLFLATGTHIARTVGLSGDEPHYLLIAHSLLQDLDLRVQDDYGDEEYRRFYGGRIGTRLAVGTPYPVHGIGAPLLLMPGFALGGLTGVLVTEALLSALLLYAIHSAALIVASSHGAALFAAAAFALTSPALFLSTSAYPELPAALLVALIARRAIDRSPPRRWAAFGWMLAASLLPFFHVKFVPLALVLGAAFLFRFPTRWRPAAAAWALGAFALLLFSYFTTGSIDPTASYGRRRIFLGGIPIGIAGLFFDQEFGLLLHAPVYLLGLAGIVSLFRRGAFPALVTVMVLASVLLPSAAHPLWSGGTSPPARFLFPALPLLAVAAACLVAREPEVGIGRWSPSLLASSVALGLAMLLLPGGPFFLNARSGTGRVWEALSSSWNLTDYLPSIIRADSRSLIAAALLALGVVVAIVAQVRRADFRFFPAGLLLVLGFALQDLTSVPRSREMQARWVTDTMHRIARHPFERYLVLPPYEVLTARALSGRMVLRLEGDRGDGDPRNWWTRAYSIPAGTYRLRGLPEKGTAIGNGGGVFLQGGESFSTGVALARFRLRAPRGLESPELVLIEPGSSGLRALATVAITAGLRLHSLDGNVHQDPRGLWVPGSSRASFALELASDGKEADPAIVIANGGAPNRLEIESGTRSESLELAPWEERRVRIPLEDRVAVFSLRSESGFQPAVLDPRSTDRRNLGVLLRSQSPFD